ncbi:manganese transport protein MntH [Rhodopirellula maiorica SM1]|uniref:Manganese transport protein MntH n=2 Tax=Novipirellula TaxID=2795426 RepID=M5S8N1_9BACT|nr:manganese transport protein MntH [Rhodopirellula maiorica SM1]
MSDAAQPTRSRFRLASGPGLLVTAAFIGPGTVVTASRAGTEFGCSLLWTVLFAVIGTILLQSMAARLGILTGSGLSEAIRESLKNSPWLRPMLGLVVLAIGFGNAAYQTGNLTGAVVGVSSLFGGSAEAWTAVLGIVTTLIIATGRDRLLQRVLVCLVVMLSIAFLYTAATGLPSLDRVAAGLFVPRVTSDNLTLVLAMIGTTIVPYNLFLHASRSASTWKGVPKHDAIRHARWDTAISIALGGLVTAAILLTASGAFYDQGIRWNTPDQIAAGLRPTLGAVSGHAFAIGLFCAGLTSAVTAPLATAYAVCGCLGWPTKPSSKAFRAIAISVIAAGVTAAMMMQGSPVFTIVVAQVTNGMLLPIVAALMLVVIQKRTAASSLAMSPAGVYAAWTVVALVSLLGLWRVLAALGF